MNDANVAIRLKGFIDSQGLSHSQFADQCEIPRPSLSQILSGRNKKVSDIIVGQIHKAFPDLSILWLLFGEGDMLVSDGSMRGADPADSDLHEQEGADFSNSSGFNMGGSLFDNDMLDLFPAGDEDGAARKNNSGQAAKISFQNSANPAEGLNNRNNQNVAALNSRLEALNSAKKQIVDYENKIQQLQLQIEKLSKNPRSVSHITVYYDDSTFETFFPRR